MGKPSTHRRAARRQRQQCANKLPDAATLLAHGCSFPTGHGICPHLPVPTTTEDSDERFTQSQQELLWHIVNGYTPPGSPPSCPEHTCWATYRTVTAGSTESTGTHTIGTTEPTRRRGQPIPTGTISPTSAAAIAANYWASHPDSTTNEPGSPDISWRDLETWILDEPSLDTGREPTNQEANR